MGWKYPSHLTTGQRALLRRVEQDPFHKPRSKRTKARYAKLVEDGYIKILSKRTGKAEVDLDA